MSFLSQISKFRRGTINRVQTVRSGAAIKLFGAVVDDTPVEEGRLRGNWQIGTGTAPAGQLDRKDPSGQTVMQEIEVAASAWIGDGPIFFANNLPYAVNAEFGGWHGPTEKVTADGFSEKAPAGMVRRNTARFDKLVKQQLAK